MSAENLSEKVTLQNLLNKPLTDWWPILSKECSVYVFGENYIAKRFDQINYKFCDVKTAKEILIDNLYALLRYKYFPKINDDIETRIGDIISSFTKNLKTILIKISFEPDDGNSVNTLEDGQIAFKNGVYDFIKDEWLFKYNIISMPGLANQIYVYDSKYIIQWYFDFNFEPLPIKVMTTPLLDFINMMKDINKISQNYCFELMYNIAHDSGHKFSFRRFVHLCEILGYTCLQSFSQNFILLIGSGQNGKNSLFDGCFTNKVRPRPASNSLDDIEKDRFVTGSLENVSHNIFLETSAQTYTESKMIKALTGSMYQTIESKSIQKYNSIINCKYVFSGNDQAKIKFSDNTNGFRRRINILEIFYQWDPNKKYLSRAEDYYDITFSDSLKELKDDIQNVIAYIYFAMYGILSATKNFKENFKFTENDWKLTYSDVDFDLKDQLENITPERIVDYITNDVKNYDECKFLFYDTEKVKLSESETIKQLGYNNYDQLIKMFKSEEATVAYFSEFDVYMNVRTLQSICGDRSSPIAFTSSLKKIYMTTDIIPIHNNKSYIKVTFVNNKLRVVV